MVHPGPGRKPLARLTSSLGRLLPGQPAPRWAASFSLDQCIKARNLKLLLRRLLDRKLRILDGALDSLDGPFDLAVEFVIFALLLRSEERRVGDRGSTR